MSHPAQLPVEDLLAECSIKRTRRSGPGGQHRNKVETAVVVEHLASGVRGEASERRSQEQNRQQAVHRLRVKLALELRSDISTQLSELWRDRARTGRLTVNAQHVDFPALLAEALDVLHSNDCSLPKSAEHLGVTASQLVKFLKVEPAALVAINLERKRIGAPPLR